MEKISVEVQVPATGKKYEFIIPSVMKVGIAADLIAKAIVEQEEGLQLGMEMPMLCAKVKACVLDDNLTIEQAGIRDGNILLLV